MWFPAERVSLSATSANPTLSFASDSFPDCLYHPIFCYATHQMELSTAFNAAKHLFRDNTVNLYKVYETKGVRKKQFHILVRRQRQTLQLNDKKIQNKVYLLELKRKAYLNAKRKKYQYSFPASQHFKRMKSWQYDKLSWNAKPRVPPFIPLFHFFSPYPPGCPSRSPCPLCIPAMCYEFICR